MRHLNNVVFLRYFETARINYMQLDLRRARPGEPRRAASG